MNNIKKIFQILLGVVISGAFLFLTFSEVNFYAMLKEIENLNFFYLAISLVTVFLSLYIKSLRWGSIIRPILLLDQKEIFPISSIGIAAITILPFRLGEIVRPLLLSRFKSISFSQALATIVFERITDSVILILILSSIIIFSSLPSYIIVGGEVLFFSTLFLITFIVVIYNKFNLSKKLFDRIISFLPEKLEKNLSKMFENFFEGLTILSHPRDLMKVFIQSSILWLIYGLIVLFMFNFHDFELSLIAAFSVVVITFLAASIPAAPGFLGTFQYGCYLALTSYGISSEQAALFSLTYYMVMIGMNIIVGLIFYLKEGKSFNFF